MINYKLLFCGNVCMLTNYKALHTDMYCIIIIMYNLYMQNCDLYNYDHQAIWNLCLHRLPLWSSCQLRQVVLISAQLHKALETPKPPKANKTDVSQDRFPGNWLHLHKLHAHCTCACARAYMHTKTCGHIRKCWCVTCYMCYIVYA